MTVHVTCFGGGHIDRKGQALTDIRMRSSNPVRMTHSHGGVARNVAENMSRLGAEIRLVTRLGRDADAGEVMARLDALGVETDFITRSDDLGTASYTALLDEDGETVIGLADMEIYDQLTPDSIGDAITRMRGSELWFADSNLPIETLEFIAANKPAGVMLAVDAVSVAKATKLRDHLDMIDILFCQQEEAETLSGRMLQDDGDYEAAGLDLTTAPDGARKLVIARWMDGAFYAEQNGTMGHLQMPDAAVIDNTGYRDALIAATLLALVSGKPMAEAVEAGLAASAIAVEGLETCPPALSIDYLADRQQDPGGFDPIPLSEARGS
ncbi:MAG: winged helix-turn-helix transcriptional regulator [Alphaproteobacteria bacterium]